jgi:phosphoribosyl 1,2-cyclic phosphate phosphodiesterase
MDITILGSGGCAIIPKPLCDCPICKEARRKGPPYARTGPAAFIHDENLLIDTPAEIATQLNMANIEAVDNLMLTHLDPDHVEGIRVIEQITLDFRTWEAYPDKQLSLVLPGMLANRLTDIQSVYGPLIDYYEMQGFVKSSRFNYGLSIGEIRITAVPVFHDTQVSYIYVFEKHGKKIVYAPCDIKPFPEERKELWDADLLVIQPGIFEDGLKHDFVYPEDHISRTTLYTFEQTLALTKRIKAKQVLFVHLEEYWNRSLDDYFDLQKVYDNVIFAYDGLHLTV